MADRPVWWQAQDKASMLQLLKDAAGSEALDASPRPAPEDADVGRLHEAAVALAKERVAKDHSSQDRVLMEEVKAIDDLVRAANLLVERLREWHGLQAADTVRAAADAEALVEQVKQAAPDPDAMDDGDHAALIGFTEALEAIHSSWRSIEARVTDLMQAVAPNVTALVGPMVGARLITLAGGLPRLAAFPSSTIQTLGAETALFRHIKEKALPPKHGILFQHPLVFQARRWQRGAIARSMANHLALAARADATTGRDIQTELKASLDDALSRIRSTKARPTARNQDRKGRSKRRGRARKGGGRS